MAPKRSKSNEKREKARLRKRLQRSDIAKKKQEQKLNTEARRADRLKTGRRTAERLRDAEAHRTARLNPEIREEERVRNTEAHRVARLKPEKRAAEKPRDAEAHRAARLNPEIREEERVRNTEAHRVARLKPEKRAAEKPRDAEAHRIARLNPEKKAVERSRNTEAHRVARLKPERKEAERSLNTEAHRVARLKPEIRALERPRDAEARRITRSETARREAERLRDTEAHQAARSNPVKRKAEQMKAKIRKATKLSNESSYNAQMRKFFRKVREAPSHVCSCCGRLWYKSSITCVTSTKLTNIGVSPDLFEKILHVNNEKHGLCVTCWKHVKAGRLPKLALVNGFGIPEQSEKLKGLSPLEERLVAGRIPFMQIRGKGLEKQSALLGNIVNVECDLNECAKVLPRQFNETSVVQVLFKRRMEYKHAVWNERIRPQAVYNAAKYLVTTPGYRNQDITLSPMWNRYLDADSMEFVIDEVENQTDFQVHAKDQNNSEDPEAGCNDFDEFHNPPADLRINLGAEETLIYDNSALLTVAIAPGANKIPIPLNRDLRAEELSFPCTWCGQERRFDEKLKITLTDVKKSDITQYDRRAATPQQVLYAFRKSNNEHIKQQIQVCLRRRKGGEVGQITAGNIKTPGFVDNLVQVDDGYRVFKNIRGSPAYLNAQKKKVVAMVRQKGKCTFFLTCSAAETKWPELLVMLMKIVKKKTITEDEAMLLTFEEKAELIRSDPVTCMRHFDNKYRAFLSEIIRHKNGALNPREVSDFFSRLEFQVRGSPHMHSLLWIKDAPVYTEGDPESEEAVVKFIDDYITCKRDEEGDMENLIGYQIHRHSNTCKKGKRIKCRFSYPKPPLPSTRILKALPKETPQTERTKYRNLYRKIEELMNQLGRSFKEDIAFEEFLSNLECTEEDYVMAIRSTIKRDTVFLKRDTSGMFVNGYNKNMLLAWRANMDLQFVLDTYACAKYCVGYVTKAEGGVSKLLQAAEREIKRGNLSIKEQMCKYGSVLINGAEISAQESVAYLLGIPMTRCSRVDVFVNTSPKHERVSILKPNEKLEKLEDDDEDIFEKGLLDHYVNRPTDLENVCLAEFASMYNFSTVKPRVTYSESEENIELEDDDESNIVQSRCHKLIDGSGYVTRRRVQKIIRFRNYSRAVDEYNHCREKIMLFIPWRDEETDFGTTEHQTISRALDQAEIIKENSTPFYGNQNMDEKLLQDEIENIAEEMDDEEIRNRFDAFDVKEMEDYTMQFLADSRTTEHTRADQFRLPEKVSDGEYYVLMQSLNEKQRRFVMSILHSYKTGTEPFHIFLSGGAGVGKSHVITTIIQSIRRYDELFPTQNPEDVSVLVSAPTGKAAFNVHGMTVHGTFQLPPTQSKTSLLDLQAGPLNTLRIKFRNVKLIIIDEVSMLSSRDLYNIDKRLRQIFNTVEDFGGRSILVVGHMRQLPPVMASFVFADLMVEKGSLVGNYLWKRFHFYELDEIMRQKGEYEFCKALNNMAEGTMDDEDVKLIKTRQISEFLQPPSNAIRLFYSNQDCQEYNINYHNALKTEGAWSYAFDRIEGQGSDFRKRQILHAAKEFDASKSDGIPYKVHLQVDAVFFVSTNVDVKDGLFNGSSGKLMRIDYSEKHDGGRIPTGAWLLFEDLSVGAIKRGTTRTYQIANNIPLDWTLIQRVTRNLSKLASNSLQVIRTQMPLVAANGMTIHKSQGSTLQNVVVCIGKRGLKRDLKYVACSRAKSLSGLYIDGSFSKPNPPSEADPVTKAMGELRQRPMIFPLRYLQDYLTRKERLYFHNVQSFPKYQADLTADHSVVKMAASTVMIFVEPHIRTIDDVNLPGYECVQRRNSTQSGNSTKSDGVLVFRPEKTPQISFDYNVIREDQWHLTSLRFKLSELNVISLYRHPRFPLGIFYSSLETSIKQTSGDLLIVGDINLDLQTEGRTLLDIFAKYGITSKISQDQATTNRGTAIDICFSNANVDAWIMETYYSYHKSICVVWG